MNVFFATDIWDALANPGVTAILGALFAYLANRAYQGAQAKKANIEGVILTAEKVDELSNTILTLRNALGDSSAENNKLNRAVNNCQEDCAELKECVREFLETSEEIHRNAGDKIILRQVEGLKKKITEP
jgi:predicted kinase